MSHSPHQDFKEAARLSAEAKALAAAAEAAEDEARAVAGELADAAAREAALGQQLAELRGELQVRACGFGMSSPAAALP